MATAALLHSTEDLQMNWDPEAPRAGRFERPLRIRFGHCDPAGIVYFPQYFVMFTAFVEDWVTEGLGISYYELLGARRVGLPTVRLHSEFMAISRMGDVVTLGLQVKRLGSKSMTLALDCTAQGQLRMRAQQVIVTTSLETHKAIDIPQDLRSAIQQKETDHDRLCPLRMERPLAARAAVERRRTRRS